MKSRDGKSQRREEEKKEDQKRASLRRKKIQVRETVGKSRNTVFFLWFVAPEGRKVGLLKAASAEPAGQMRAEKLHAVVARSAFLNQNLQNKPGSDHFWKLRWWKSAPRCGGKHICKSKWTKHNSSDHFWKLRWWKSAHQCGAKHMCKMHKNTSSDHFWKLWCRKSARRCGGKRISKSKCTKHTRFGPLLEVEMMKKCTHL